VAESSHHDSVLLPPEGASPFAAAEWARRLDAAVADGTITQEAADAAWWQYSWPYPDEIRAVVGGTRSITVYDEAHLVLLRTDDPVLTAAQRRMKPVTGTFKVDPDGDLVCIPNAKNGQRAEHRRILAAALSEDVSVVIPPTGRPAGSGFGPKILCYIESRSSNVPLREAIEQAAAVLNWQADNVLRAYRREKKRVRSRSRDVGGPTA
jgi:hypothetical protein